MATLSFRVDGLDEIVWWALGRSGRAKVLAPEKLRELVVERLRTAIEMDGGYAYPGTILGTLIRANLH